MPKAIQVFVDPKTMKGVVPARRGSGIKLTLSEICRAMEQHYPPVISLDKAAEISNYRRSTLKRLISEGKFKNSVKRKKPVLFWRDRFVQELMQG